jgi:hypothetical protein
MKLQIDTTQKVIKVEGTVSLLELTETLERFLPNGVWKTFSLECGSAIIWAQPYPVYPSWPYYPWWTYTTPTYVAGVGEVINTTSVYQLTNDSGAQITYNLVPGTYNVEI